MQLGVGGGAGDGDDPDGEWAAAGVPTRRRGRRTDAFLAALPGLLAGEPTALPEVDGNPVVRLAPAVAAPPLWIGGASDAALRRTVRFGGGWLAAMLSPARLAERVAALRALAERHGAPAPRVGSILFIAPGASADPAAAALRGRYGLDAETAAAVVLPGSSEQVADGVARFRVAGANTLVVGVLGTDVEAGYDQLGQVRRMLA